MKPLASGGPTLSPAKAYFPGLPMHWLLTGPSWLTSSAALVVSLAFIPNCLKAMVVTHWHMGYQTSWLQLGGCGEFSPPRPCLWYGITSPQALLFSLKYMQAYVQRKGDNPGGVSAFLHLSTTITCAKMKIGVISTPPVTMVFGNNLGNNLGMCKRHLIIWPWILKPRMWPHCYPK